jgi:hypothetical protein
MTTKTAPKKRTKLEEAEFQVAILTDALYMDYDDKNELLGLLYLIIEESEKTEPNLWMLRKALKGFRTALINNQHTTMDCAGLEY